MRITIKYIVQDTATTKDNNPQVGKEEHWDGQCKAGPARTRFEPKIRQREYVIAAPIRISVIRHGVCVYSMFLAFRYCVGAGNAPRLGIIRTCAEYFCDWCTTMTEVETTEWVVVQVHAKNECLVNGNSELGHRFWPNSLTRVTPIFYCSSLDDGTSTCKSEDSRQSYSRAGLGHWRPLEWIHGTGYSGVKIWKPIFGSQSHHQVTTILRLLHLIEIDESGTDRKPSIGIA